MKCRKRVTTLISLLVLLLCGTILMTACSTTENTSQEEVAEETVPPIYEANDNINQFIIAFNERYPDMAVSSDDLTVYHHHGEDHESQVWTNLGNDKVLISAKNLDEGVTVFYETYSENNRIQDYADANRRVFDLVMPLLNPELDDEAVAQRWQDVLDDIINAPEWDDGIKFSPGPSADYDIPASFEYFEVG